MRRQWCVFWFSVIGTLGLLDYWRSTKHDGSTLSECVGAIKDSVPHGDVIFAAGWNAFARWFEYHLDREG